MRAPGLGTRLVHFGFGPRAHRYLINQSPVLLRAFTGLVEKSHFNLNGFIQAAAWDFSSSFAAQLSLLLLTWSSGLCRPRELYVRGSSSSPMLDLASGQLFAGIFSSIPAKPVQKLRSVLWCRAHSFCVGGERMVLFNDLLSFPLVLLNRNWGGGEAQLSKNPAQCVWGKLVWVLSANAVK